MCGSTTQSIIRVLGVVALVLGLASVAWGQGGPPARNPGQPFAEILAQIGILNDKLDALQTEIDNLPGGLGPCEVPPVWGQTYATTDRFVPVLGGAAFCDQATGLVWEGSPVTNLQASWQAAVNHCTQRTVGGQKGFHLPLIEQLASLLPLTVTDLNSATGDGPFTGVQQFPTATYWSATTTAANPALAWTVDFLFGNVGANGKGNAGFDHAWCVRGGQAYDGQDVLNAVPAP